MLAHPIEEAPATRRNPSETSPEPARTYLVDLERVPTHATAALKTRDPGLLLI